MNRNSSMAMNSLVLKLFNMPSYKCLCAAILPHRIKFQSFVVLITEIDFYNDHVNF